MKKKLKSDDITLPNLKTLKTLVPYNFSDVKDLVSNVKFLNPVNCPDKDFLVFYNNLFGLDIPVDDLRQCEENVPRHIFIKFMSKVSSPSVDTLKNSSVKYPFVYFFKDKALEVMLDKYELRRLGDKDYQEQIKNNYKRLAEEREVFVIIYEFMRRNGYKDLFELREVFEVLVDVSRSYNFSDLNVNGLVESLVDAKLSYYRICRDSEDLGVLERREDKNGNVSVRVSAVESAKTHFNKCKVDVYLALNKVMEGEKINIHSDNMFSLGDFMKDIRQNGVKPRIIDYKED